MLAGCGEVSLPVPPQRTPVAHRARVVLEMGPGALQPWGAAIRTGVDPAAPNLDWRWMTSDAAFDFELEDRPDWQVELHLTAVDKILAQVGTQRLVVLVNGKEVGRTELNKPGPVRLRYPAPKGGKTTVEVHVEPCVPQPYTWPYCALIHSLGFSRELK